MAREAPLPSPAGAAAEAARPRPHLVVVVTRALREEDGGSPGAVLRTRFWHPHDHRWSENDFESLEHARRLFVEESAWVLRQEQQLDGPLAHELIFEARREDFTRATKEQILRDIGMTPQGVNELLERVERRQQDD